MTNNMGSKNCSSKMVDLYAAWNQPKTQFFFFCWNFVFIEVVLASTPEVMLDSLPSYEMCAAQGLLGAVSGSLLDQGPPKQS